MTMTTTAPPVLPAPTDHDEMRDHLLSDWHNSPGDLGPLLNNPFIQHDRIHTYRQRGHQNPYCTPHVHD